MIHPEYSINPGTSEEPPQVQTANDVAKNSKVGFFAWISHVNRIFAFWLTPVILKFNLYTFYSHSIHGIKIDRFFFII